MSNLYERFQNFEKKEFPYKRDYVTRFNRIREELENKFYPEIEMGALWASIQDRDQPIYLNGHGRDHIEKLIDVVTELVDNSEIELTAYEYYILLTAILIHDAGNIHGRENHEKRCSKVIKELGLLMGDDNPEKRIIRNVAAVHGGEINNDKDTISYIKPDEPFLGKTVRVQKLAALLRFADELADDKTRASRYMLESSLLKGSEVFHAYSKSLVSVTIKKKDIDLRFDIDKKDALKKFQKIDTKVFLVDEIYRRTMKMYLELIYCSRFLRSDIKIDRIKVTIDIYKNFAEDELLRPLKTIDYVLEESGYPNKPSNGICDICPHLKDKTGVDLKSELERE